MSPRIGNTLVYENEDLADVPSFVSKGYRTIPRLYVNGSAIPTQQAVLARPGQTLLSYLRDVLHLTGSKLGCGEGGCGACTVMISRYHDEKIIHYSVNACLMPVLAADGMHVTTIEHLGSVQGGELHPIQQAMVDMHGSQCG
jgi:xanthine dehydrogenase/oxidase